MCRGADEEKKSQKKAFIGQNLRLNPRTMPSIPFGNLVPNFLQNGCLHALSSVQNTG